MSKKKPSPPPPEPSEVDLPEGWVHASLGDGLILDVQPGFACGTHNREGHGTGHLRPMNVSSEGAIDLSNLKFVPAAEADRDARLVKAGDVIFNNTNSAELVGKTACYLLVDPLAFSNHMTRLRCRLDALEPQFCAMQLHQRWREGHFEEVCNHHVSQASVGRKVLLETAFSLPPLAEQKRIVAKVEELLGRVNAARARLARLPAILKRFRHSVLAAACSGQLTAEWREVRKPTEDAPALLRRVAEDRRASALGGHRKRSTHTDSGIDELYELPETWAWATLSQVGQEGRPIIYGIIKPGPHDPKGVPYVRVMEMKDGSIDVTSLRRASNERAAKFSRATLEPGDLLISKDGTIGRVAVVPPELAGGNITQHLVRAAIHRFVDRCYVVIAARSPACQNWLTQEKLGVALQGVNVEDFRRLPIPLPPCDEQHEIVRRVEALFALADGIEARVHAATVRAERLPQSILARAFRGELVPTEAELAHAAGRDYEPASVLLEQVQEEHERRPPAGRRRVQTAPSAAPGGTTADATKALTRTHSRYIHYKRAAIAAYIIDHLHKRRTFGRVQFEKCLYLAEAYVGVDLEGEYQRAAAGPLDSRYLHQLESAARKNGWFVKRTIPGDQRRYTYHPGSKAPQLLVAATKYLGDAKPTMDHLLHWMEKCDTEQTEIIATLFAAWNDLLRDGQPISDDLIIAEVRQKWHESKQRFTPDRLRTALAWMRQEGMVPSGASPPDPNDSAEGNAGV